VIAATNSSLERLVDAERFREDLYYRLHVVRVHLPPLRDCREDIPLLVERLCASMREMGADVPPPPREVLNALATADWPGNVRQLEGVVRRLAALGWHGPLPSRAESRDDVEDSAVPLIDRRRGPGDELFDELTQHGKSFWATVHAPFLDHELTRRDLRLLVKRGLLLARGNYTVLARMFNIPPDEYKRFMDFLRKHDCNLPYRTFR
jgi:DNA-binding NtrC family response regulator